jgi:hypothetical protein
MKRVLVSMALALVLAPTFIVPAPASAHFINCSSVERGDIHWKSSTVFTTARDHAISVWRGLGSVGISKDTIWTTTEIEFIDINRSDLMAVGLYTERDCGNNDDRIRFNRFFMDGMSDARKKNVALHELGHALGLGHSFIPNVMNSFNTTQTALGTHDKDDYWALWGRPYGPGDGGEGECGPVAC